MRLLAALGGLTLAANVSATGNEPLEHIRTAAQRFLEAQQPKVPGIQIEVGALDARLRLAACSRPLESYLPAGAQPAGRTTVGVRCPGPAGWSIMVPAQVRRQVDVIVAVTPLARGVTLAASDLRTLQRDVGELPPGYVGRLAEVVGKQLRQPVLAGNVLVHSQIESPLLVRRGDPVTVISRTGALEVRASGEALTDGSDGDSVRVRNTLSKKMIQATVIGTGLVQVNPIQAAAAAKHP